jgi:hypothetical protein
MYHRPMNARTVITANTMMAILLPLAASAETFRCGKWIISAEMTPEELTSKCGAPTSHESRTEDIKSRNRNNGLLIKTGETTTETWTYDRGSQAAPMVVTIIDGRIKSIERLEK